VIGGAYLSNIRDGYIVDIGGMTTDAACVKDGFVGFKKEGIQLRGFKTAVKTMNVHTFGLGGDSYIRYDQRKEDIFIGPERVVPICYLAREHPELVDDLKKRVTLKGEDLLVQPAEFFLFQKEYRGTNLHPQEAAVMKSLRKKSPMSRRELSERVGAISVSLVRTERLETFGNILRAALTPSDVLHASGSVSLWNVEAAKLALSLYAERAGKNEEDFCRQVLLRFYRRLLFHLFEFWFSKNDRIRESSDFSHNLSSHLFFPEGDVQLNAEVNKPIVFIGAPAQTYARGIGEFIGASINVPEHYGVANAIGAITGVVRVVLTVLIRPMPEGGYVAYTKESKKSFDTLDQAKGEMKVYARRAVREKARMSGALHLDVEIELVDREVKISQEDTIYLETVIKATVSSVPVSGKHRR
jgi:N-methylhydantoinase A/oxoprolinase/acetone carboxylase beta subunit